MARSGPLEHDACPKAGADRIAGVGFANRRTRSMFGKVDSKVETGEKIL